MHLFSKENIWSNPQQFPASCIHPNNNSVDRIISKEEEREDPRRELQSIFEYVVFPQIIQELQDFFEYSVFYSVSTCNPATPSNSTYRINSSTRILQEILQLQGSSCAGSFQQLFPVHPSILHGRIGSWLPYSTPGPHGTSRLPVNSTRQKQHSKWQPASTHSLQQFPGQFYITEFYQEK